MRRYLTSECESPWVFVACVSAGIAAVSLLSVVVIVIVRSYQ
jgi:hypothetical protein